MNDTTSLTMDKHFQPENVEPALRESWHSKGYFTPKQFENPYCIIQPPPNVTGYLHMGHGFQLTLMDALIRYKHMSGHQTLWQAGMDHAGIATQMVVERQLEAEGQNRHDLGREAFNQKVWDWKAHAADTIHNQVDQMGAALDWENEAFTLDPKINEAVAHVFESLYDEGLIYRAQKLVNWDTSLQSAVSDLEVESQQRDGMLWHIRYPLADHSDHIIIATTRPETLFGDTAVAVHPEDSRYQHLIGKMLCIPECNREIPIIADDYVEPEFGTGALKITPAHDFNDYEVGMRHKMTPINILHLDGRLNGNVPEAYQGLSCEEARKQLIAALEAGDFLVKSEPYLHQVPICERSGTVIEPMLTPQWFMAMETLAKPALEAVQKGEIRFTPSNWENTYAQWLENIQDWCLSRQLWWGHRIPAWYDDKGNVYVGKDEASVKSKYSLDASLQLTQDNDVLDTWFSSALWPFVTLGWPEETARLKAFYPTDVLVTGFDIIFFWVARMVMMGIKLTGDIPFKHVVMTGLIRDSHGQKMSKSKGNVLDPLDLIHGISLEALLEKRCSAMMQPEMKAKITQQTKEAYPEGIPAHGTDALRFTFCALANTGRDIKFELGRLGGYKNFCNKLWNAARYVLMQTQDYQHNAHPIKRGILDEWLLDQRDKTVALVHQYFKQYRFDLIASTLYEFTWQVYCDWALEMAKVTLSKADEIERHACQATLLEVLADLLKLLHPIMPYITDAIWPNIAKPLEIDTPHLFEAAYPVLNKVEDIKANDTIDQLQSLVTAVRTMRSEAQVPPQKAIETLYVSSSDQTDLDNLKAIERWLLPLSKCESIALNATPPEDSMTTKFSGMTLAIPLTGLLNKTVELQKISAAIAKLQKSMQQSQNKLNNPEYRQNAPETVVQKEEDKLKGFQEALEPLLERKALLNALPD